MSKIELEDIKRIIRKIRPVVDFHIDKGGEYMYCSFGSIINHRSSRTVICLNIGTKEREERTYNQLIELHKKYA